MATYPYSVPSGTNIYPEISGTDTLGTISNPFLAIYVNGIYSSGSQIAGSTEITVNYGTTPTNTSIFTVSDARVSTSSYVNAFPSATTAAGRVGNDDNQWDNISYTTLSGSGTFTLYAKTEASNTVVGNRIVRYSIL